MYKTDIEFLNKIIKVKKKEGNGKVRKLIKVNKAMCKRAS